MWFFPLAAAIVSAVFSALIAQQWLARQRPNQLAWSIALLMFAIASFAAAIGVLDEWTRTWFRIYYLFGAIVNVPILGLGTIYLLGPRKIGHAAALLITVASIYAAGAVFTAPISAAGLDVTGIPSAREVLPDGVRAISRYFSYAGFIIVVAGALWSAWRVSRSRAEHLKNLALGNILIAGGTFVVALAGVFARFGQGAVFSIALLVGVTLMFWGFLTTRTRRSKGSGGQHEGSNLR